MLTTTTRRTVYTGNGVTTVFAVPWYWLTDGHVSAQLRVIASGSLISLVPGTDYALVGVGNMFGGTLTTTVPVSALHELIISRTVPIVQLQDYIANDALAAETVERGYDYLTMICQQLSDAIAAIGGGSGYLFQNIGTGQGHIYAGTAGTTVQLKTIKQTGGIIVTETANEILIGGGGGTVDLEADYPWHEHIDGGTGVHSGGFHSFDKQAKRTKPSWRLQSLELGVDIADSSILLKDDYVAMMDLRKRTAVNVLGDVPVDPSWGGNFALYCQHEAHGVTGTNGTLAGGIRVQMETSQIRGGGTVNDCVAGYFGLYNNGTDVGGFAMHTDAYHVGAAGASGHSTIGSSIEMYKQIAGGVAAGVVVRQQGAYPIDYGMLVVHSPGGTNHMLRGLQFGCPAYAQGGVQGSSGSRTFIDVGIDMTWADYQFHAIVIPRNNSLCLSGMSGAQSAVPDDSCWMFWSATTGYYQMMSGPNVRWGVNMSHGNIIINGNDAISMWDGGLNPWLFSFTSSNKVATTAFSGAINAGSGGGPLTQAQLAGFIVMKTNGIIIKVPYYNA